MSSAWLLSSYPTCCASRMMRSSSRFVSFHASLLCVAMILCWTSHQGWSPLNIRPLRSELSLPTCVWNKLQGANTDFNCAMERYGRAFLDWESWCCCGGADVLVVYIHKSFWLLSKSYQLRSSEAVSGMAMLVVFNVALKKVCICYDAC